MHGTEVEQLEPVPQATAPQVTGAAVLLILHRPEGVTGNNREDMGNNP